MPYLKEITLTTLNTRKQGKTKSSTLISNSYNKVQNKRENSTMFHNNDKLYVYCIAYHIKCMK